MFLGLIMEREIMVVWRRYVYYFGKKKCYYVVIIFVFRLKGKVLWKGFLYNFRIINIYIKFEFVYLKSWFIFIVKNYIVFLEDEKYILLFLNKVYNLIDW